ncbi:MAG: hypothetical protein DRO88_05165 [Promethearchaeia archaeon]|nr:MAG: hypothetical protein DRO88_05165 [Candidatus Lokiarchaeia archaeon]
MIETPYIEVEIISSQDPKQKILDMLKQRAKKNHHVKSHFKGTPENPILRVDYDSLEQFKAGYNRDRLIYENFIKFINLQEVSFSKIPLRKIRIEDDDIYLIMKYRTNCKEPIRNNYNFTFRIIELIGLGASFEEVQDGFILFYQTKEDFKIGLMDLLNLEEVRTYLDSIGMLIPSIERFLNQIQDKTFKKPPKLT